MKPLLERDACMASVSEDEDGIRESEGELRCDLDGGE